MGNGPWSGCARLKAAVRELALSRPPLQIFLQPCIHFLIRGPVDHKFGSLFACRSMRYPFGYFHPTSVPVKVTQLISEPATIFGPVEKLENASATPRSGYIGGRHKRRSGV